MMQYNLVDRYQLLGGTDAYILRVERVTMEVAGFFEILVHLYQNALRHALEADLVTVFSYFSCFSSRCCI
jgi:hypothetical protein